MPGSTRWAQITWPNRSISSVRHQSATVLSTNGPRADHAGIVDQQVDRPEQALDVGSRATDSGFIRHVGDEGSRAFDFHGLPSHDRDLPACRGQRPGEGAAEPAPAACDHRDFHASGLAPRPRCFRLPSG
jgi:hypothetical protein